MLIDNLPALEGQTSSETITNHLNAMHAARAAFIKSEACKNLGEQLGQKRGLQHLLYMNQGV